MIRRREARCVSKTRKWRSTDEQVCWLARYSFQNFGKKCCLSDKREALTNRCVNSDLRCCLTDGVRRCHLFWNCHLAHTHIQRWLYIMRSNVCIWELLSLIVFVFVIVFIVMHNGLSCQCVSVVPAGGAIFGEAVRRHKPAPCNQLYFYFLYFVFVCWFFCIVYSFDVLCILI